MTDSTEVTKTLARYVVNAKYDDIPGDVRHEAKRALLNWLGCAIGTAHHETIDRALAALAPFAGAAVNRTAATVIHGPRQTVAIGQTREKSRIELPIVIVVYLLR